MIAAELHHKIGELKGSEDVLTSTVFGFLKYPLMRPILLDFLGRAIKYFDEQQRLSDTTILEQLGEMLHFHFWKMIQINGTDDFTEPDLLIEGENCCLMVEVKYKSELSGEDQLRRYQRALEQFGQGKPHRALIYLTADPTPPILGPIALSTLEEKEFYWLSWLELHSAICDTLADLGESAAPLANDLLEILKIRGLEPFVGFTKTASIIPSADFFWTESKFFSDYDESRRLKGFNTKIFWEG